MDTIDLNRWAIYFVFGVPFLAWVLFTQRNPFRLIAVVAILIFVQRSFATRRYLWAIGVGPSVMVAYTAFIGLFLVRRRLPTLGVAAAAWGAFLFFALTAMLVGSLRGPTELLWNFHAFQELYLEGFLFFLIGAMAFTRDDELREFFTLLMIVGFLVAVAHYFCLSTGYRFPDFGESADEVRQFLYGGFFTNVNSQGCFYAMTLPIALSLVLSRLVSPAVRVLAAVSLVAMIGSLLLSWHRGGFIVTSLMVLIVIFSGGLRPSRAFVVVTGVALAALAGYFLALNLLPDTFARILETKGAQGLETERWTFWQMYIPVIVSHPFGVGLTAPIVLEVAREAGIPVVPHNIYMNMALQTGFVGLFAFLAVVGAVVFQNLRAWRRVLDPRRRQLLLQLFVAVSAFLLVGLAEPVYDNGQKLNNFFWLMCGISLSTSFRMLAEARRDRAESVVAAHGPFEQYPAPGL